MAEELRCVVEIPRGSRNKYEWDEELGGIALDRFLSAAVVYPTDYGFVAGALGADDEPMDALIAVSEPTFPGCMVRARSVALMILEVEGTREENLLCVPVNDPGWQSVEDIGDVDDQLLDELHHFFATYHAREGKDVGDCEWRDRAAAEEALATGRRRWEDNPDAREKLPGRL
jgi:inorganic pyrophosphatase